MTVSDVSACPAGGEFVLRPIAPEEIFVPEDYDSDERLMAETAAKFCRGEVLPLQDRLDEKEEGLMPSLIRKAGELGLTGPDIPEAYGGLGLGKGIAARILELASLNGSFAVTLGVQTGIAQLPISLFGSVEQKEKYLPAIASGERIGAYALSEPNAGSDPLGATTKAVLSEDGTHYILNGTKAWISNAAWADTFIVFAKVDGDKFTSFVVERGFPGVLVEREEHKLGMKGSSTARLVLEDAKVPVENVIFEVGKGLKVALNALNIGRYKLGAMALGPARESLHLAAVYAKDRKQFGKPICEFGLIQRKLARMTTEYFVGESILARTGALIDSAMGNVDPKASNLPELNMVAAEEYAVECSLVKLACSEAQAYICDEAIQVHGGYGFTEEFDVARHHRDARVSRIYEGTNEINRIFAFPRWLKGLGAEALGKIVGALDTEFMKTAPNAIDARRTQSVRMMALHCSVQCLAHPDKAREQEVAADMTDILGLLYAMETVAARARKLAGDPAKGDLAAAISAVFSNEAHEDARRLAGAALEAVGSDSAKLEAYESRDTTDSLPRNRRIAHATLDAAGYPF